MLFFKDVYIRRIGCGRHGAWRADRITGKVRVFCLQIMAAVRPAVAALILLAGVELFKLSVTTWYAAAFAAGFFLLVHFYKKSPIFYILLAAVLGVVFKL